MAEKLPVFSVCLYEAHSWIASLQFFDFVFYYLPWSFFFLKMAFPEPKSWNNDF